MTMNAIEAHDLVREHKQGRGVCGVTLAVARGECFALLGRNGSGKTTLTRLLLGMERPAAGTLFVSGERIEKGSRKHLGNTGASLDTSIHWEQLSGWQNAYFAARSYGLARSAVESRLEELFVLADLRRCAHDPVRTYSFGMRRKLSHIQALCHDPELLVLDEPTGGVDAHFCTKLAGLVSQRTRQGRTTWIAGNDPDWISGVATRVGFMDSGKICAEGTPEALVREVAPFQEVRVVMEKAPPLPFPPIPGIRSLVQNGNEATALMQRDPHLVPGLVTWIASHGGVIKALDVQRATLRDAFLLKTGRELKP